MATLKSTGVIFLLAYSTLTGLFADNTIKMLPYNVSDTKIGYYEKGHFGKSLAISNDGPEYPVYWLNSKSSGGTMSYWFKPTRPCRVLTYERLPVFALGKFYVQAQLPKIDFRSGMGDGKKFRTHARSFAKGRDGMTISVCGKTSKIKVSDDFYDRFHHVAVTWTADTATIYFDGEVLGNHKLDSIKFEPKTMGSLKTRGAMNWLDEMLILRKPLSADEIKKLYQSQQAWTVDASTAFYAGFDGSLASSGMVPEDGALPIAYTINTGAAANVYPGDTVPAFNVTLVNPDSKPQSLAMRVKVEDLAGKTVFDKSVPVTLAAKAVHYEKMEFAGIGKGLFYSDVKLVDANGRDIKSWHIVFAATDAVRSKGKDPYDVRTGFVFSRTYNPVAYASWIRLCGDSAWYNLEYAPGKWDFARLDMLVNEMLNDGRRPQLNLSLPPVWRLDPKRINHIHFNLKDLSGWKDYVTRVATRYKGRVFNYEILNEPYYHTPIFSAREYGQLCAITADILHEVDPRIKAIPAFGGYPQWEKTLAKVTAKKADYYAIHPYMILWSAGDIKSGHSFENMEKNTIGILKEAGANQVLVDTEVACYTLFSYALKADGRPMTCAEFEASGNWNKMGRLREYGRRRLIDYYTGALRMVRLFTMERALNSKYTMYWAANVPGVNTMVAYADHPTPMSAAYANLSKFFYGDIKFIRCINTGTEQSRAFLFKRRNDYMIVTWSLEGVKDDLSLFLNDYEPNGKIKSWNYFMQEVPWTKKIDNSISTILKPVCPLFLTGIKSIPEHDYPVMELENIGKELYPGMTIPLTTLLANPLKSKLTGSLEITLPGKFKPVKVKKIVLNAGERKTIRENITVPDGLSGFVTFYAVFKPENSLVPEMKSVRTVKIKRSVNAPKQTGKINVDGVLTEWGDTEKFPIRIDSESQLRWGIPYTKPFIPEKHWLGTDDLSAVASIRYDEENLYIAVKVKDDTVENLCLDMPGICYQGDSVELMIDGRGKKQGDRSYSGKVFHIKMAPSINGSKPVFFISKPLGGSLEGVKVASKQLKKGYTFEIAIPFSNFPELRPQPGTKLGFDIYVSDNDEIRHTHRADTSMSWSGLNGGSANPELLGKIILDK